MDSAFGRDLDAGESADQALADLASTPTAVLSFRAAPTEINILVNDATSE